MAQNDGRGTLEITNMQLLLIRILFQAQMEGSVKWAQIFSFEVPPPTYNVNQRASRKMSTKTSQIMNSHGHPC